MELNSTDHTAPAWLTGHQRAQEKEAKPNFQGFVEPRMWPQDGGTRREPVMDMDAKPPCAMSAGGSACGVVSSFGRKTCCACVSARRNRTGRAAATDRTMTVSKTAPPLPVVSGVVRPEARRPGRPIANRRT